MLTCRVCGKSGFPTVAGRRVHEGFHVRAGEARYVGPAENGERPIEKVEDRMGANTESSNGKHGQKIFKKAGVLMDTRGHTYKPYDGTPCEVCGATTANNGRPFQTRFDLQMHRNWHVRHGEARWSKHAKKSERVLIPIGKGRELATVNHVEHEVVSGEEIMEQMGQTQVDESAHLAGAVKTLQKSLTLLQLALALEGLPPERAMQLVGTLGSMGHLKR